MPTKKNTLVCKLSGHAAVGAAKGLQLPAHTDAYISVDLLPAWYDLTNILVRNTRLKQRQTKHTQTNNTTQTDNINKRNLHGQLGRDEEQRLLPRRRRGPRPDGGEARAAGGRP